MCLHGERAGAGADAASALTVGRSEESQPKEGLGKLPAEGSDLPRFPSPPPGLRGQPAARPPSLRLEAARGGMRAGPPLLPAPPQDVAALGPAQPRTASLGARRRRYVRAGLGPREGSLSPCAAADGEQPRRRPGDSGGISVLGLGGPGWARSGADPLELCRLGMEEPFLSAPGFLFVPSCVSNSAQGCYKPPGFERKARDFFLFQFSLVSLLRRGRRGVCVGASLGSPQR